MAYSTEPIDYTEQMQTALADYNKGNIKSVLKVITSLAAGVTAGRVYEGINIESGEYSKTALKVFAAFSSFVNGILYADSMHDTTGHILVACEDLDIRNPRKYFHCHNKKSWAKTKKAFGMLLRGGKWYVDLNLAFSSASFLYKTTEKALDSGWAYSALAIETFLIIPSVRKTTDGVIHIGKILWDPKKTPEERAQDLIQKIKNTLKSGTKDEKSTLLHKLKFLIESNSEAASLSNFIESALNDSEKHQMPEYTRLTRLCEELLGTSTPEIISSILAVISTVIYGPSMIADIQAGNKMLPPWLNYTFALTSSFTAKSDSPIAPIFSSIGMMIILTQLTKIGTAYLWDKTIKPMIETVKTIPSTYKDTWSWAASTVGAIAGGGIGVGIATLFGLSLSPVVLGCSLGIGSLLGTLSGAAAYRDPTFLVHASCILLATLSVISSIKFADDGVEVSHGCIKEFLEKVRPLLAPIGVYNGLTFNSTGMASVIQKIRDWVGMTGKFGARLEYPPESKALVMAMDRLETMIREGTFSIPESSVGTIADNEASTLLPLASSDPDTSNPSRPSPAHSFLTAYYKHQNALTTPSASI